MIGEHTHTCPNCGARYYGRFHCTPAQERFERGRPAAINALALVLAIVYLLAYLAGK